MAHIKGFFKKITGDNASYDALAKQPIADAETKLNIFKEVTNNSISGLETYLKYMQKKFDLDLADKFYECKELFKKYEQKGELLNPNISHILGIVFGKLNDIQMSLSDDVFELVKNIEQFIVKPLNEYQKEISIVKDNRKELKDAYDRIEQCCQSLEKARKELDNASRTSSQTSRLTMMGTSDTNKRMNDINRFQEKVQRLEKELDEANSTANEKYDKYTEGLFKRVAEECDLTNYFLEYLKFQRNYHKQAYKKLDQLIPDLKKSLSSYNKKPVFGCSLAEYVSINNNPSNSNQNQLVSPVIRKLIESMCKQNVFNEEGIFRVAGSRIKMNCILYAINAGYIDHLDTNNDFDVHCLAGVLKQYIRELPDSILCNDFYDYWINAINTPMPNKLEAFKQVLQALPKTNYENLKYLIKFLAKIVENSEKTKMTMTNMGICFGVSLLSSNNALKTSSSVGNMNSTINNNLLQSSGQENNSSGKMIDMATATNVFDFLLSNHQELFPGDINFMIPGSSNSLITKHSFYHSSNKVTNIQSGDQTNNYQRNFTSNNNNNNLNTSTSSINDGTGGSTNHSSNRYSVMVNDSISSLNDTQSQPSPFSKLSNNSNNTSLNSNVQSPLNATSGATNNNNNNNITHVNRHVKKNSMDIKFLDQINETSVNMNTAASNTTTSSNTNTTINKLFPSLNNTNSNSTISLDKINEISSGSSSPKMKGKKQAPAPPKVQNSNESPAATAISITDSMNNISIINNKDNPSPLSLSTTSMNTHSSVSNLVSASKQLINNSETSISSTVSTNSNNLITKLSNQTAPSNTNNRPTELSSSSLPSRSLSFRANEQPVTNTTVINTLLEKPNQPPPQVPVRTHPPQQPPPIGFSVSISESPNNSFNQNDSPPYPTIQNQFQMPNSKTDSYKLKENMNPNQLGSSVSSTTSSTSSLSQDPLSSPNNTLTKPPKPTIPRRPGSIIAQHLSKFERRSDEDVMEQIDEINQKSQSEVTSL